MRRGNIVITILIIALLVLGLGAVYYYYQQQNDSPEMVVEDSASPTLPVEGEMEDRFKVEIPEDADKAELSVPGTSTNESESESEEGEPQDSSLTGIVARENENGEYLLTLLADLPDLESAEYSVYLTAGIEEDGTYKEMYIGNMRTAKGGYLFEMSSEAEYSDYDGVVVKKGDEIILEGKFSE